MFYPVGGFIAGTELDVEMMSTVEVNDEDLLVGDDRWTRSVLVANIEAEAQFGEAGTLVKPLFPNL
jgi:hypothetical protein